MWILDHVQIKKNNYFFCIIGGGFGVRCLTHHYVDNACLSHQTSNRSISGFNIIIFLRKKIVAQVTLIAFWIIIINKLSKAKSRLLLLPFVTHLLSHAFNLLNSSSINDSCFSALLQFICFPMFPFIKLVCFLFIPSEHDHCQRIEH